MKKDHINRLWVTSLILGGAGTVQDGTLGWVLLILAFIALIPILIQIIRQRKEPTKKSIEAWGIWNCGELNFELYRSRDDAEEWCGTFIRMDGNTNRHVIGPLTIIYDEPTEKINENGTRKPSEDER